MEKKVLTMVNLSNTKNNTNANIKMPASFANLPNGN